MVTNVSSEAPASPRKIENSPYLVLGLDIGIGSCGFALLDMNNERIVEGGVRLWEVPQEPKTKASYAQTRRDARSARRNIQRTAARKKHCLKLFRKEGLVPNDANAQYLQTKKGDLPTIQLRAQGLDRKLSIREWTQVLYSFCGNRGYIPHGEGNDVDAEGKKVISATKENEKKLEETGCRTIGEMFAKEQKQDNSCSYRNKGGDYSNCIPNSLIVEEIKKLFNAQRGFGSPCTSEQFEKDYLEVFLWQKDVSANDERTYKAVGACTYFPEEKRAANACFSAELCKAYERLGHIRWVDEQGKDHPLPPHIRQRAIETLFSPVPLKGNKTCKVTYGHLRKLLNLSSDEHFKSIDQAKESKEEVFKPKAWRCFRDNLPAELVTEMRSDFTFANNIASALTYASSEESLKNKLEELNLEKRAIKEICRLPYTSKLFTGYGKRSLKALDLLLASFEDYETVCTLYEAEDACGLAGKRLSKSNGNSNILPPYFVYDPTNKNPVVLRVMGQVRRVVNAICKEHGVPHEIHIELARELKQSKKERDAITSKNKKVFERRESLREQLAESLRKDPSTISNKLLRKFELRDEQSEVCPYCGKPIEFKKLLFDDKCFEIDHVLPFSRTCDDSQMNKVLVHASCNQNKGTRTPYEWFTEENWDWDEFSLRITRSPKIPAKKKEKLLNTNLKESESAFIARNLNDTRYASTEAKDYIEEYLAFPETDRKQHVVSVAGGATSVLRNAWQLKKIREEDNIHHFVDAAVIAACNQKLIKRVAETNERKHFIPKEERKQAFENTEPWPGFANQVLNLKERIIPTRKPEHGLSGRAFEDTLYHYDGLNEEKTLAILTAKGTAKSASNYIVQENGTAQLIDGLAFVRLWWDPTIKARGKKEPGQFLLEPIYFADIPFLDKPEYVPRFVPPASERRPRLQWSPIPETADKNPISVFPGDAILINGTLRRFHSIGIATCSWYLVDPCEKLTIGEATKGNPFAKIPRKEDLILIQEDILGRCFYSIEDEVTKN